MPIEQGSGYVGTAAGGGSIGLVEEDEDNPRKAARQAAKAAALPPAITVTKMDSVESLIQQGLPVASIPATGIKPGMVLDTTTPFIPNKDTTLDDFAANGIFFGDGSQTTTPTTTKPAAGYTQGQGGIENPITAAVGAVAPTPPTPPPGKPTPIKVDDRGLLPPNTTPIPGTNIPANQPDYTQYAQDSYGGALDIYNHYYPQEINTTNTNVNRQEYGPQNLYYHYDDQNINQNYTETYRQEYGPQNVYYHYDDQNINQNYTETYRQEYGPQNVYYHYDDQNITTRNIQDIYYHYPQDGYTPPSTGGAAGQQKQTQKRLSTLMQWRL